MGGELQNELFSILILFSNGNSDVGDEYAGQGLDCGEGWLCLRGLPYSCRVVLSWGAEEIHIPGYRVVVEPTCGDDRERHDPGQLQEGSAPAGALDRYQWLALSSDLCKVPSGH